MFECLYNNRYSFLNAMTHSSPVCSRKKKFDCVTILFYFDIYTLSSSLCISINLMLMHAHVESHRLDLLTMVLI